MAQLRRAQALLGTFVEIQVEAAPDETLRSLDAGFDAIREVHECLSFQSADSELTRLNQSPGQWLSLSPLSLRVLRLAKAMTCLSQGRFNCTVGGALVQSGALPDHGGGCLPIGDASDIEMRSGMVRLLRPVRLTLDGIAKGYAVDRAVWALKREGFRQGVVNAGGDLRLFGQTPQPFLIRNAAGLPVRQGEAVNLAVASSLGKDDTSRRYPASLVGAVAAPAEGWSVCARFAWRADALTKVAASTPEAERAELVAGLGGLWVNTAVERD